MERIMKLKDFVKLSKTFCLSGNKEKLNENKETPKKSCFSSNGHDKSFIDAYRVLYAYAQHRGMDAPLSVTMRLSEKPGTCSDTIINFVKKIQKDLKMPKDDQDGILGKKTLAAIDAILMSNLKKSRPGLELDPEDTFSLPDFQDIPTYDDVDFGQTSDELAAFSQKGLDVLDPAVAFFSSDTQDKFAKSKPGPMPQGQASADVNVDKEIYKSLNYDSGRFLSSLLSFGSLETIISFCEKVVKDVIRLSRGSSNIRENTPITAKNISLAQSVLGVPDRNASIGPETMIAFCLFNSSPQVTQEIRNKKIFSSKTKRNLKNSILESLTSLVEEQNQQEFNFSQYLRTTSPDKIRKVLKKMQDQGKRKNIEFLKSLKLPEGISKEDYSTPKTGVGFDKGVINIDQVKEWADKLKVHPDIITMGFMLNSEVGIGKRNDGSEGEYAIFCTALNSLAYGTGRGSFASASKSRGEKNNMPIWDIIINAGTGLGIGQSGGGSPYSIRSAPRDIYESNKKVLGLYKRYDREGPITEATRFVHQDAQDSFYNLTVKRIKEFYPSIDINDKQQFKKAKAEVKKKMIEELGEKWKGKSTATKEWTTEEKRRWRGFAYGKSYQEVKDSWIKKFGKAQGFDGEKIKGLPKVSTLVVFGDDATFQARSKLRKVYDVKKYVKKVIEASE
tara:strand:- start:1163 stop:3181 length:2019 start_codon:yes stop_codon:yes gene_type:complete